MSRVGNSMSMDHMRVHKGIEGTQNHFMSGMKENESLLFEHSVVKADFGSELIESDLANTYPVEIVKMNNKLIGVFFYSLLVKHDHLDIVQAAYAHWQANPGMIEIIHASLDSTKVDLETAYHSREIQWPTFGYEMFTKEKTIEKRVLKMAQQYDLSTKGDKCYLLIFRPDGTIVTRNGITHLRKLGEKAIDEWLLTPEMRLAKANEQRHLLKKRQVGEVANFRMKK